MYNLTSVFLDKKDDLKNNARLAAILRYDVIFVIQFCPKLDEGLQKRPLLSQDWSA